VVTCPGIARLGVTLARRPLTALPRLGGRTGRLRRRLGLALDQRRREIDPGADDQPVAELIAQRARLDLLDRAGLQLCELERPERHANEPVHPEAEVAEHVADLAVLAFTNRKCEPHVRALLAVERGFDRPVVDAVDGDALLQRVEFPLRDATERA